MKDNIYALRPVNKASALVVSQSGCEEEETLEYQRDTLARALQQNQTALAALPKKHRYRVDLGLKQHIMQQDIIIINKKIKLKNLIGHDLNNYILTECRLDMTKQKWNEILCRARTAKKSDIKRQEEDLKKLNQP